MTDKDQRDTERYRKRKDINKAEMNSQIDRMLCRQVDK